MNEAECASVSGTFRFFLGIKNQRTQRMYVSIRVRTSRTKQHGRSYTSPVFDYPSEVGGSQPELVFDKPKLRLYLPVLLACIVIAACSNANEKSVSANTQSITFESSTDTSDDSDKAILWRPLAELAHYPQRRATARVVALDEATVAAQVSGQIEQVFVREGDVVKRGQPIAQLNDPPLRLARERAQATLAAASAKMNQAQRQLTQQQGLRTRGFVSEEAEASARDALEVARRDRDTQRAALAEADWYWEQRMIIAPFDGVMTERQVSVGDWVTPGQAIAVITATAREVHAFIAHEDIALLQQLAEIIFETLDGHQHPLNIAAVSPRRDDRAQDVRIRLTFTTDTPPPIGTSGVLVWRDPRPHLSASILTTVRGTPGTWIKNDAAGAPRFVPLPASTSGRDVVVSFPPDTLIAIRGQGTLAWRAMQETQ